jgi:Domain of unknown function (DUF4253)
VGYLRACSARGERLASTPRHAGTDRTRADLANRYGTSAPLVAVLRSWEQRFGVVLLEVGFDHVRLLVERPPRALPVAQAAAAEIWAMCDEFWAIEESHRALRNVSDIADCLIGAPFWSLWLD